MAERWTISDIGRAFESYRTETNKTLEYMQREVDDIKTKLDSMNKVLLIGNGEPSLRETVRSNTKWIDNANKFIWVVLTILIGQLIAFLISLSIQLEQIKLLQK